MLNILVILFILALTLYAPLELTRYIFTAFGETPEMINAFKFELAVMWGLYLLVVPTLGWYFGYQKRY